MTTTSGDEIQVENGNFTRIHNVILERLAQADLNGSQFRCLMFLFRKTYGFKKKEDTLSFSQWCEGTNIKRRQLIRTLQSLEDGGYIYATDNGNNRPKTYGFNKYMWDDSTSGQNVTSLTPSSGEIDTISSGENVTSLDSTSGENVTSLESTSGQNVTKTSGQNVTHKRKKETTTNVATQPKTPLAEQFHTLVAELKGTNNRAAKLREIYVLLYGEDGAPDFGYILKTANKIGGAGYMATRLWELSARPPNGDIMAYLVAEHNGKQRRQTYENGKIGGSNDPAIWHKMQDQDVPDYIKEMTNDN